MKLALVVAMANNGVIGRDNELPWHLPADLKYFKKITMKRPIIMGRLTYESIGRPLPGRCNIVITRNVAWQAEGVHTFTDIEEALNYARDRAQLESVDEMMVIGGEQIFRQLLDRANRLYLTLIDAEVEGDASFPDIDYSQWQECFREKHSPDSQNVFGYNFLVLDRV